MKYSILNRFLNNPQTKPHFVDLTTRQWHRFDVTYGGDLFCLYALANELSKDTPNSLLVTQLALELGVEA